MDDAVRVKVLYPTTPPRPVAAGGAGAAGAGVAADSVMAAAPRLWSKGDASRHTRRDATERERRRAIEAEGRKGARWRSKSLLSPGVDREPARVLGQLRARESTQAPRAPLKLCKGPRKDARYTSSVLQCLEAPEASVLAAYVGQRGPRWPARRHRRCRCPSGPATNCICSYREPEISSATFQTSRTARSLCPSRLRVFQSASAAGWPCSAATAKPEQLNVALEREREKARAGGHVVSTRGASERGRENRTRAGRVPLPDHHLVCTDPASTRWTASQAILAACKRA